MIKVLLAQILFKPAIIERELDWLGEPGIVLACKISSFFAGLIKRRRDGSANPCADRKKT